MPANVSKMDKKVVRSLRLAWKIKDFATRQITGQILILIHTPAHSINYYCLLHPYNSHNIPPPPTCSFKLIKVVFKLPHHRWLAAKSFLDIFNSLFPLSPAQPFHSFPSILQAIVYSLKKRNTHKMLWEDPFSYWFSHSLTIEQLNHCPRHTLWHTFPPISSLFAFDCALQINSKTTISVFWAGHGGHY